MKRATRHGNSASLPPDDLSPCTRSFARNTPWRRAALFTLFAAASRVLLQAQDHTVPFSTGDPGVTKAIVNWGLDVTWPNPDNMRRGLIFMGTNQVDLVRVLLHGLPNDVRRRRCTRSY
jgi:hypothetical protein